MHELKPWVFFAFDVLPAICRLSLLIGMNDLLTPLLFINCDRWVGWWCHDLCNITKAVTGFGWLVVFYIPSTARSFRDGTPIYCPLRRT